MGTVFIVSAKKDTINSISDLMLNAGFQHTDYALSGNEVRRRINSIEPELVIINAPLQDENGIDLVLDIAYKTESGILIIVRRDMLNEAQYMLEKCGALILSKPIDKAVLVQTAKFAMNVKRSFKQIKGERDDLQRRIDERKAVEKAKWILIETTGINEPEAHRFFKKKLWI